MEIIGSKGKAVFLILSGKLNVLNIWYEPGIKLTKALEKSVNSVIKHFEKFNMKK